MSEKHALRACEVITPKEIENEQIIMLKKGFYHREVLQAYFKESSIVPEVAVSTNQLKTLESLVIQGVGISFLFKELALRSRGMVFKPLSKEMPIRICLAWRSDYYLSHASRTMIDFLEKSSGFKAQHESVRTGI
jgi:DNA-binding transcriptional LysR family regulator